jgi:hypothetical protein
MKIDVPKDLDLADLFARFGRPGEELDDEWAEMIQDAIHDEGELVGRQEWDSGAPGAGAGVVDVYRFRGLFVSENDVGSYGPYESFKEAADAVGLFVQTSATRRIWVHPRFDSGSD